MRCAGAGGEVTRRNPAGLRRPDHDFPSRMRRGLVLVGGVDQFGTRPLQRPSCRGTRDATGSVSRDRAVAALLGSVPRPAGAGFRGWELSACLSSIGPSVGGFIPPRMTVHYSLSILDGSGRLPVLIRVWVYRPGGGGGSAGVLVSALTSAAGGQRGPVGVGTSRFLAA